MFGGREAFLETLPAEDRPDEPVLLGWCETPWRAFGDLQADRQYVTTGVAAAMGAIIITPRPLPLTWRVIWSWCALNRIRRDEREAFVIPLVQALDREFLADWARKQAQPAKPETQAEKLARFDATE